MNPLPSGNSRWLTAGLFLVTFATLLLEILDSRLLSVLTWYHLAFLAVSLAMLGMAAGAVLVFVGPRYSSGRAAAELPRAALWLAVAIPVSHLLNLSMPFPTLEQFSVMEAIGIIFATIVLGVPFLVAGIVVTLALTRTGAAIGRLYAADLAGAALGCLLIVPLLNNTNISSVAFVAGAAAAAGAYCFHRFAGTGRGALSVALCGALLAASGLNATTDAGVGVVYAKSRMFKRGADPDVRGERIDWSAWNAHSYMMIAPPFRGPAFYWGRGRGSEQFQTTSAWMLIDAEAGTPITEWDGNGRTSNGFRMTSPRCRTTCGRGVRHHRRRGRPRCSFGFMGRKLLDYRHRNQRKPSPRPSGTLSRFCRHRQAPRGRTGAQRSAILPVAHR